MARYAKIGIEMQGARANQCLQRKALPRSTQLAAAEAHIVASMNIGEQYRLLHKPLLLAKQKLSPPRTRRVEWEP